MPPYLGARSAVGSCSRSQMRQAKPSLPVAPEPSRDEVHDNTPCLEGGDEGLDPLTVEEKWNGEKNQGYFRW